MTNQLRVDRRGHVFYRGVRLPIRYEGRSLEFVVKHPGDRKRLGCKRLRVPLSEIQQLERRRCESVPTVKRGEGIKK